jgi:hypothetical protein
MHKGTVPEASMKIQYRFARLSEDQRAFLEMVLLEEMDTQRWFFIASIGPAGGELVISQN